MDPITTAKLLDVYAALLRIQQHVTIPAELREMMNPPLDQLSDIIHVAVKKGLAEL